MWPSIARGPFLALIARESLESYAIPEAPTLEATHSGDAAGVEFRPRID